LRDAGFERLAALHLIGRADDAVLSVQHRIAALERALRIEQLQQL
jgi:hypothetical protein